VIQACELLPIGVIVCVMGHGNEERKEQGCRRCLLALNWRDGRSHDRDRPSSRLDNRNELEHPTVPSSISYINRPRHPRSAHFPPSLLRTLLTYQGIDNADAVLSVEVKCVQAFGTCYFGSERERPSLVSSCCQTDVFSGSEIYVGCSNGEVLLFALQANGPDQVRQDIARVPPRTILIAHTARDVHPRIQTNATYGEGGG
jgi:hypothetical protein